jgi:hypothetical protein
MCIGCVVGMCVFGVTWGGGQLVAWRAKRRRERAMTEVERSAKATTHANASPGDDAPWPAAHGTS